MIDPEILENIIGYRIPNQALSSNDALEIVGFLPEGMGDSVVAYSEIPTKTGSDFDIDKMYIMVPSFRANYKAKEKVRNYVKSFRGKSIDETISLINDELDRLQIPESEINAEQVAKLLFDETNTDNLYYARDLLVNGILKTKNSLTEDLKNSIGLNQIEKLEYIRFNDNKPLIEQSKGALQNRLIEGYKAVLTHPEVAKEVMTPIDHPHMEDDIKALRGSVDSKADLHHFDDINQIEMKYSFQGGKTGTGQFSNQLVDHNRGMFAEQYFRDTNIGFGHVNSNNETVLDREFSETLNSADTKYMIKFLEDYHKKYGKDKKVLAKNIKEYRIADTISAILNGNLDIAKDPFVTDNNYTNLTNNTAALLIRSGVHPYKINRFLNQPIIKEYIEFVQNKKSKLVDKKEATKQDQKT